uniref:Uncharacterized protein n=1 Tax=Arundo donax TaxID=35708 RepID=A0A0A8YBH5_ARUDO
MNSAITIIATQPSPRLSCCNALA